MELREGESATGCDRLDLPFMISVLQALGARHSLHGRKECLPNQFHVNGLRGNHSPLVGFRALTFKTHTKGERCRG